MSWIADLAGICQPTRTEAQALKIIPRKPKWKSWTTDDPMWEEEKRRTDEWHKLYGSLPRVLTAIVEVKTTRADFKGDKKWLLPSPADLRYLAIPPGLIRPEEYPPGWGILEATERQVRRLAQLPTLTPTDQEKRFSVVYNIAMRQHNRITYAHSREANRTSRSHDNEYHNRIRISHAVSAALHIARGQMPTLASGPPSVERILQFFGIDERILSDRVKKELESLWAIQPAAVYESDGSV